MFEAGAKQVYPCESCPGPLSAENADAWTLFLAAASKGSRTVQKTEVDYFEIDWGLVRLLVEVQEIADPATVIDKLVALVRGLNTDG